MARDVLGAEAGGTRDVGGVADPSGVGEDQSAARGSAERLAFIRAETRFELGLLHERVSALVGAEAFLTISYTGAMSNSAPGGPTFSAVVAPILSGLGLLLALLAWPGVGASVRLVLDWTADEAALLEGDPALSSAVSGRARRGPGGRLAGSAQWRSMLFYRATPGLFAVVWTALTVIALVLPR